MKFRAAVLEKLNAPLALMEVELTTLQVGQVLVKNIVSGLCGAQLHEIKGHKGNAKFLPHLMGHEGCGIVEAIGPGVTTVKVGDKVVMHWRKGEGIDAPFPKYVLNGKEISSGKVTTLSEYSIVSENRTTAVPSDTSPYLCALLGCGMTTALGTINNDANLKFGESVLIIGCGGVGLNLIQGAKLASAYPIVAIDIQEDKKEKALALGATAFINAGKHKIAQETARLDIAKFDVIIDTTGISTVISETFSHLADNGKYILVGQPPPDVALLLPDATKMWTPRGQTVKVSQGGDTAPHEDIPRYIKMYKAGLIDIEKIITHVFPLEKVNEAFDLMKTGNAGRIMIHIDEERL